MTQNIPVEWVACALDLSSQAIISRRRLSADQVLCLVLGMAVFHDKNTAPGSQKQGPFGHWRGYLDRRGPL